MKKFIRLHNENDNSPVVINVDDIICIDSVKGDSDNNKKCGKIYLNSQVINPFKINETPEKVYSMLEEMDNDTEKKK